MHPREAVKRLNQECRIWRQADRTQEVVWILKGLEIAKRVLREMGEEELAKHRVRRPRLSYWLAGDMFLAMREAVVHLANGRHAEATKRLRQSILKAVEARNRGSAGFVNKG